MKKNSTEEGNKIAMELYAYTCKEIVDMDEAMIALISFNANMIRAICSKETDKNIINLTVDYIFQQVRYQLRHQLKEIEK